MICAIFPYFGPFSGGRGKPTIADKNLWTPRLFEKKPQPNPTVAIPGSTRGFILASKCVAQNVSG